MPAAADTVVRGATLDNKELVRTSVCGLESGSADVDTEDVVIRGDAEGLLVEIAGSVEVAAGGREDVTDSAELAVAKVDGEGVAGRSAGAEDVVTGGGTNDDRINGAEEAAAESAVEEDTGSEADGVIG